MRHHHRHESAGWQMEGFDVARYGEIVNSIMPTFGEFLQHEGSVIASGNFSLSQSPLNISVEATERILQHAREKKIHTGYPALMAKLLKDAHAAGYADEELASVIKVLRKEN